MAKPETDIKMFFGASGPKKNNLSHNQIVAMDASMQKFKVKKMCSFPTPSEIEYTDEIAWLKSVGAISKDGGVYPTIYEQKMEDWWQWRRWKWGQNMKIAGYEEMSKTFAETKKV